MANIREEVFERYVDSETFTVQVWKGTKRYGRLQKLLEQYPDEMEEFCQNKDGSALFHIPESWVRINPPVQLSEEEAQRRSERGKLLAEKYVVSRKKKSDASNEKENNSSDV